MMMMRKALLTSSEVSVLASICVVVLFTLALFLSGYALQQRTLHELRLAVRPGHTRPSPRAHLPSPLDRATGDGPAAAGKYELEDSDADADAKAAARAAAEAAAEMAGASASSGPAGPARGEVAHPDPRARNPLPVTRAERRRLIKEEVRKLARTGGPAGRRWRLW
ncbi:uncharacterized protein UV8b_01870 [Ustilaginoidea virens]|uniref:Uncharacterized protein n=1 Tax=Ustilaginoidea virens TaxID=1159556 RepID=A0A8E5HLE5_USTVR|nr:uncharacterized protein UV8b_01870 [Ustilaginoidea virens]QUC17629.1 hypothetical protein UV8b_01870 [Ustilaginoidea virens]